MINYQSKPRILGIAGSLRQASYSQLALQHAMPLLSDLGCCVTTVRLLDLDLPFCSGDNAQQFLFHPGVTTLRQTFSRAHGLVLVTPEYHGSFSGVLKNALDLLDRDHLKHKVAGLMSVLGGPANTGGLHDLARIMRACHAWVLPEQIAIGRAHTVFVNGRIADTDIQRRLEEFALSLARSVTRLCGPELASADSSRLFAAARNLQISQSRGPTQTCASLD